VAVEQYTFTHKQHTEYRDGTHNNQKEHTTMKNKFSGNEYIIIVKNSYWVMSDLYLN
jgi:hypothetical protein